MWLLLIPAVLVLFLIIICVRALMFRPKPQLRSSDPIADAGEMNIDMERAIAHLQAMVKLETVWNWEEDPEGKIHEEFCALLPQLYPLLHEFCSCEKIGRSGLLYHLPGKSSDSPTVYMAHYDVVPADAEKWQKPPYSAVRENGEIWGRGTLDTKGTLCAVLEAAETLLAQGFVPNNDIYFSFGGDEETDSTDTETIVDVMKSRGIKPALVLDEGGAVVENIFPGVKLPLSHSVKESALRLLPAISATRRLLSKQHD